MDFPYRGIVKKPVFENRIESNRTHRVSIGETIETNEAIETVEANEAIETIEANEAIETIETIETRVSDS